MTEKSTEGRLLIVDDESRIVAEYVRALAQPLPADGVVVALSELRDELFDDDDARPDTKFFEVETCHQGEQAVGMVKKAVEADIPYAAVFLDLQMPPGMNGIETAKKIRALDAYVNIVVVTGSGIPDADTLAATIPPADRLFFFQKPFHAVEVRQLATALCGKWKSDIALRQLNERLEDSVRQRTAQLHEMAYFDSDTGLPNRRKLMNDLASMLGKRAGRHEKIAVVLFDIERFSFINETLGYEFGTGVLQRLGQRLRNVLRDEDIAGRFGADEFACLIGHLPEVDLPNIAGRVRSIFSKPFSYGERDIYVKCSMGVAVYPDHGLDPEAVFRSAEAALHRSKRHVIHETIYYEASMGTIALQRFQLEAGLRDAIAENHIQPYFQPQISLSTGEVTGVEVLSRWVKPDGEIVPPDSFIPVIEETGLSDELFASILCQSAPAVRAWREQLGYTGAFSINVSAHQVRNDRLLDLIGTVLKDNDLGSEAIKLELTETVLLSDFDAAKAWLEQLAEAGIEVQIDDFGTGYSSLKYLAELPFSALKIDRSFLTRLLESVTQRRIVSAMIALGHALGVSVTAEGIETDEHMSLLRQFGCDVGQGYLIGRPMPDADFRRWFSDHRVLIVANA